METEVKKVVKRLFRDEGGQSTIEYAILSGIISVAAISMIQAIRVNMVNIFTTVQLALQNAAVGDAGGS